MAAIQQTGLGEPISFFLLVKMLLVAMPGAPIVASLLLVAMPFAPSSFLLLEGLGGGSQLHHKGVGSYQHDSTCQVTLKCSKPELSLLV